MDDEAFSRLQDAAYQLAKVAAESLGGEYEVHSLRSEVLAGIGTALLEHFVAINELATGISSYSAEVLLRTILEGWMIAQYVAHDQTDDRAIRYILQNRIDERRFYRRIRDLAQQNPSEPTPYLRAALLGSLDECDLKVASLDEEIAKNRAKGRKALPSLWDCATAVSPNVALVYAQLYGFLLSDEVHLGAGRALRRTRDPDFSSPSSRQRAMRKVFATAYALYCEVLELVIPILGRPGAEQIARLAAHKQEFLEASS